MKIAKLVLSLLIILFISGCGGWTMFGTVIRQDGQGVPDVYVSLKEQTSSGFHTQIKSPDKVETKTDSMGFFRFDNLNKGKEYGIFLSKKINNEEMLRNISQENYNFKRFKSEQLAKMKVTEIAIIKGKVAGVKADKLISGKTDDTPIKKDDNQQLEPISEAIIKLIKTDNQTERIILGNLSTNPYGEFAIRDINESGSYRLEINKNDYEKKFIDIDINIGEVKELGIITIQALPSIGIITVANIDQRFKSDLDNEQLTEELRQELAKTGIDLKNAKITKKGELWWLLECEKEVYTIKEVNDLLQIQIEPLLDETSSDIEGESPRIGL